MDRQQINALLEALPLPALVIGPSEIILGANDTAQALLGQGMIGRHFITALRQPNVLDVVEATLKHGTTHTTRYLGNDGAQDTTFVVNCAPVDIGQGAGALICFEDVTHVEQVGQMRRDFVANVSHELRSPLTALSGFIETLLGPAREDEAARERFLGIMQIEASRMERLVRDLLSLSRVESEERQRPTTEIDILQVIGSVLHTLQPLALDNNVEIKTDFSPDEVLLPGDQDQLQQVLTNLIENAIKYGGKDQQVLVRATTTLDEPTVRGPAVVVAVRDQGPGIDPVHIPRLTERFYRVDSHRSREMGGTGLGLAIVKHILNRHRGRLRIESRPGHGSEFRVILPMVWKR
ncbi:ATP-binding protein [Roseovarius sp. EL26]|uniref:ATP-binding protein n=1 Tax=Roseovarius sp. EL26 TaxID=2126672 RepID=UPI000EA1CAE4|nr:ATP-binding protein [Roseovarius sp. EL26]